MKRGWSLLVPVVVLLFAGGFWRPSLVAAVGPLDPAAEQVSMVAVSPVCCVDGQWRFDPVLMDADGSHLMGLPGGGEVAWSPDGQQFLKVSEEDIVVVPATGGAGVNLTNHPGHDGSPTWSPDGTKIAFASDRDGTLDLYVMNADGSDVVRLPTGAGMAWKPTWSPDGARLAFACIVGTVPSPWWSADLSASEICAIGADGSAFTQLTHAPGADDAPAWEPNGTRILFSTYRYGTTVITPYNEFPTSELATMAPDGTNVTPVSAGLAGFAPAWSSDGTRIAFVAWDPTSDNGWGLTTDVLVIDADGSGLYGLAQGYGPAWRPTVLGNDRPVASFTSACTGTTCTFDASASSDSDGALVAYAWDFGDGASGSGPTVSHTFAGGHLYAVQLIVMDDDGAMAASSWSTYLNQPPAVSVTAACTGLTCTLDGSASADPDGRIELFIWRFGDGQDGSGPAVVSHTYPAAGSYTVSLTATDNGGATATGSTTVVVAAPNIAPVASFTSTCAGLACSFDASASADADGRITAHAWAFGDGATGSGERVSCTYAAPGTYTVRLTITDDAGAAATATRNVTVTTPTAHVGDLDRASTTEPGKWTAIVTFTVHDGGHGALSAAVVSGAWNDGRAGSCTTGAGGQCALSRSSIPRNTGNITFTVAGVAHANTYRPADNHDPDGDSDGTRITVSRP